MPPPGGEASSRVQWNGGGYDATPVLPKATPVGALSVQMRCTLHGSSPFFKGARKTV